jgi:hypothetical protein
MPHSCTVKARAIEEALAHLNRAGGKLISNTPSETDPETGKVTKYLVVWEGGTPWIALPEDR